MRKLTLARTWLFVGLFAVSAAAQAQAPPAAGHWEGAIQAPGQEIKIQVDLQRTGDKWEGAIAIPAQNLAGFPLSDVSTTGDKVSFAMKGIPGTPQFSGTVSKDGKSIEGEFTQGGGTVPFAVTRTGEAKIEPAPKSTPITKELEGTWQGALDVNGTILRLVVKLSNRPDGTGTGTLVSVDQNEAEIPITAILQTGSHVKLLVPMIVATYEGDLKDGQLTGTWSQGRGTLPLTFKRP